MNAVMRCFVCIELRFPFFPELCGFALIRYFTVLRSFGEVMQYYSALEMRKRRLASVVSSL